MIGANDIVRLRTTVPLPNATRVNVVVNAQTGCVRIRIVPVNVGRAPLQTSCASLIASVRRKSVSTVRATTRSVLGLVHKECVMIACRRAIVGLNSVASTINARGVPLPKIVKPQPPIVSLEYVSHVSPTESVAPENSVTLANASSALIPPLIVYVTPL